MLLPHHREGISPMTRAIELTQGKITLVDDDDLALLAHYRCLEWGRSAQQPSTAE